MKNRTSACYLVLGLLVSVFHSKAAVSQVVDYCLPVLTSNAFNTYESETSSKLIAEAKEAMCKSNLSKEERRKIFDGSFDYDMGLFSEIGIGSLGTVGDDTENINQAIEHLCKNSSSRIDVALRRRLRISNPSEAIAAWLKCVEIRKDGGLYSALRVNSEDPRQFDIDVQYKASGGVNDKLQLVTYEKDRNYSCKAFNKEVDGVIPKDETGGNQKFTISCKRDIDKQVTVAIEVNIPDQQIGPFTVPSTSQIQTNSEIQILKDALRSLQSEFGTLSKRIDDVKVFVADEKVETGLSVYGTATVTNTTHICTDGKVLVGLGVDAPALGKHRTVSGVIPPILEGVWK